MAAELPSISIVVPNYNGAATIGQTLESLIAQNYPRLEIIVVDGGSMDSSVEIIRSYERHLAWWVSEKDRGQAHAINKGFARATGEVVNWLCSDDQLLPEALLTVGRQFAENPEIDVLAGRTIEHFSDGRPERLWGPYPEVVDVLPVNVPCGQPSCFYRRKLVLARAAPLDESFHYALDTELWTYFQSIGARWKMMEVPLSKTLTTGTNKTASGGIQITHELERLYALYRHEKIPLTFWHRRLRYPLERIRTRHPGWGFGLIYFPYQCAVILLLAPFYGYRRVRWMNWVGFA